MISWSWTFIAWLLSVDARVRTVSSCRESASSARFARITDVTRACCSAVRSADLPAIGIDSLRRGVEALDPVDEHSVSVDPTLRFFVSGVCSGSAGPVIYRNASSATSDAERAGVDMVA